jgi:hypothetical protein
MKLKKGLIFFFIAVAVGSAVSILSITYWLTLNPPKDKYPVNSELKLVTYGDSLRFYGNSWIHHSHTGLYEMYVEGNPAMRGNSIGALSYDLIYKQEKAFVNQIRSMIPSYSYLRLLRFLLAIGNRHIDKNIPEENLYEISGISKVASDDFDFIGNKYQRILNYHGAHDIGHMLQNYHLVGCTSFAAWGDKSADSGLIIGRNFDFYVGDEFAEDKIVCFVKPDSGYKFMMITWGGMIGVVSGMNDQGLTITINAAKSHIPVSVKTPISIVARNVLQHAKNIEEAEKIAATFETFVSESMLIGSAKDGKAAIIEKSPYNSDLVISDSGYLVCTNHFQGKAYRNDPFNIDFQSASPTLYRYCRTKQLVQRYFPLDEKKAASILRNDKGMNDESVGYMNEMAVNQYLAHHSIIFKPEKLQVWISTKPYTLGEYVCYDLNKIFSEKWTERHNKEIYEKNVSLQPDKKLMLEYIKNIPTYKTDKRILTQAINTNTQVNPAVIGSFIKSNPDFYLTYMLIGDYYFTQKDFNQAVQYYNLALTKKIGFAADAARIKSRLAEISEELRKFKH